MTWGPEVDLVAGTQGPDAQAGKEVRGAGSQYQGTPEPAGDGQVGAEGPLCHSNGEHLASADGYHHVSCHCPVVELQIDIAHHGDVPVGGEPDDRPSCGQLEGRGALSIADQPIGQPESIGIGGAGRRNADGGNALAAGILHEGQRAGLDDLDEAWRRCTNRGSSWRGAVRSKVGA
jgi:hypothetical protein